LFLFVLHLFFIKTFDQSCLGSFLFSFICYFHFFSFVILISFCGGWCSGYVAQAGMNLICSPSCPKTHNPPILGFQVWELQVCIAMHAFSSILLFFFFVVVVEFELRILCLLSRHLIITCIIFPALLIHTFIFLSSYATF
jgi:hypothetical protein